MKRVLVLVIAALASWPTKAEDHISMRADGSALHWSLHIPDESQPVAFAVLAQGSGCMPAMAGGSMRLAAAAFAAYAVLTVEKYGVESGDASDDSACSEAFVAHMTMSQRIADYRQILDELRGHPQWNGRLVLFGGSEGGLVMARLSAEIDADATVLLSAAPGVRFGDVVRAAVPLQGQASLDAAFAAARLAPESLEMWGGYSYRFWADSIDRRVADDMIKANTPFLVIQGGRDVLPAGGAYAVTAIFAEVKRSNLTYWEEAGYDHGMSDEDGQSHLAEVLARAVEWVHQKVD